MKNKQVNVAEVIAEAIALFVISPQELQEKVHRGAKVLDQVVPGWEKRVNLKTLHMGSSTLCMLGQLFGDDAETAIAKEMYPELWEKLGKDRCGYITGCRMIPQLVGGQESLDDIDYAPLNSDLKALGIACSGADTKCYWAEEAATRLVQAEESIAETETAHAT